MKTTLYAAVVLLAGCASNKPSTNTAATSPAPATAAAAPAAGAQKSLYDRLGGKPAITAVVDEFTARVAADKRINMRFINTDIPQLKVYLVEFFTVATGGAGTYTGRDMKTAHASMNLVDEEFNALVEALVGAFKKFNVPQQEQNEVLGALGPLKPQIVNPPSAELAKHDAGLAKKATDEVAALRKQKKDKAADILEVAVAARTRGQRSYAEQLFSIAEHELEGGTQLASIAPLFREGAPQRITTKLKTMPKDTPPQPKESVGNSDEEEGAAPAKKNSLGGTVKLAGKPLKDRMAVVMLTPVSGKYPKRPVRHRVIEQRDRQFAPHIMAVPVGSTVSFPNFDPVFHNVFSVAKTKAFDLGIYKNGETRDITFDQEGFIRLGCNLHANMSAYLIVVAAPHYVPTDKNGHFKFRSLQPGKYHVKTWVEGMSEPVTQTVEVKAGDNSLDIDAQGAVQADLGTDKFGVPRGEAQQ